LFFAARHSIPSFDAAGKPQGAPGLDIDIHTTDGQHIIWEIKTTVPYIGAKTTWAQPKKHHFRKTMAN